MGGKKVNAITENILREAADAFAFDRTTGEISRYGEGHINDTFVVWASDKCKRYIMQRINTDTFKNPKELMENVCCDRQLQHGMLPRFHA